ncbi:DUF3515 family protein [Kineococcus rubinsiae]|uniref:DUF3515 family protein n=1 Tax=Kineococcus rubinsiae TaxID=2609562 RepID=UPI0014319CFE|nr:DUF3515 family protein [Kineococcus rubinsiae]NIZ90168.1 DUF3515 family protein [Kineococcus rubinsiae]
MTRRQRIWSVVVVVAVVAAAATAVLSRTPAVEAAPAGGSPACAQLLQRLPASLDGLGRVPQGAPGVAVWGGDRDVVLRCGAAVIGPTTKECLPIGPDEATSVDWVRDAQSDRAVRFLTYGRDPAVEVTVRFAGGDPTGAPSMLVDLAAPVGAVPQTRACV